MKILLIEDDRELAESMKFQLEKEGYETDICDDGEEGLYYMKERSHDLVIHGPDAPVHGWHHCFAGSQKESCFHTGDHADCTGRITG